MSESLFADHFSSGASDYARFRPTYPSALFAWLASAVPRTHRAWDCATGNGQAAFGLAEHFDEVVATDASAAQLASATRHPRVNYSCATAERSALHDRSIDLVAVAQALHWLDLDAFYREAARVVVPGGVIAVWSYGPIEVDGEIDVVVGDLYRRTLGKYWPTERAHVDNGYRDLAFPFDSIECPVHSMSARWTLADLLGYIGTWSAARRYIEANGGDALHRFAAELSMRWGNASDRREVRWPLMVAPWQTTARMRRSVPPITSAWPPE